MPIVLQQLSSKVKDEVTRGQRQIWWPGIGVILELSSFSSFCKFMLLYCFCSQYLLFVACYYEMMVVCFILTLLIKINLSNYFLAFSYAFAG